jgi:hypothetical protein
MDGRIPSAPQTSFVACLTKTYLQHTCPFLYFDPMDPRFSLFLRAIGVKRGFRRTGPSSFINIAVAAGIGIISGRYIFKEPLEEYWTEQRAIEAERLVQENGETTSRK